MKAIILAAGQGKRLGNYTQGKPKCLLRLGDETILSREIRLLKEIGIEESDIYVLGGYESHLLETISPNLIKNDCYDRYENSYSLGLALSQIPEDDMLVMDADLCFDAEMLRDIIDDPNPNVVLSRKADDTDESTGIVTDSENHVKAIGKDLRNSGFVYLSIFKFSEEVIKAFSRELLSEEGIHTWYTIPLTRICERHCFINLVTNARWHEIDYEEDYLETLKLFNMRTRQA